MPDLLHSLTPLSSFEYRLFISHVWDYAEDYDGVVHLLNNDRNLRWKNLSIPIENPIKMPELLRKSNRHILKQLDEKIKEADALLVLAGMYVAHSGWVQSEIESALEFGKPIIGVKPRGQDRIPFALEQHACEMVGWTTVSITGAVRRYAKPMHRVINRPTIGALGKLLQPPPSPPRNDLIPSGGLAAPTRTGLSFLAPPPGIPSGMAAPTDFDLNAWLREINEKK